MDIKVLISDYDSGTVLECIMCTIITCVNFICMCRVCKGHVKVTLTVLSLLHNSYMCTCHSIILEVYL